MFMPGRKQSHFVHVTDRLSAVRNRSKADPGRTSMWYKGGLDRTVGTLFDRAVVQGGTRVAVTHGARSYTYAELGRSASRLTAALQALHVGKGDRVAFLMPHSPEYITCEYAVAKAGATRVPLASVLGDDDYVSMLNRARCKVLIYAGTLADRVRR